VQAPSRTHNLTVCSDLSLCLSERRFPHAGLQGLQIIALMPEGFTRQALGIAAEQNVHATACHIRGDGDGSRLTSLSDDHGFAFVILGVQHLMLDAVACQHAGQHL